MSVRKIVCFDEDKCNGCGECVPSCAEGAIQIIDGKARLVSDTFCDGLGACLGECPMDAITIEEREAPEFDEIAAMRHVAAAEKPRAVPLGCPSARLMSFGESSPPHTGNKESQHSSLNNWPVQLTLVPPHAPFLKNADILLAADCVPFAYPDFHRDFLSGKVLLIACPKLDEFEPYLHKMAQILQQAQPASITILRMEVPCCGGLTHLVKQAVQTSGIKVEVKEITVGVQGKVLAEA
jgi:Pyruvate/2-oxoacid:ferredoxin oxidoreductase delta subunit